MIEDVQATVKHQAKRTTTVAEWVKNHTTGDVRIFRDEEAFFNESGMDAILIATTHSSHADLAKKERIKCLLWDGREIIACNNGLCKGFIDAR
jgi:predicted dehydrogenase